ncbi:MAG: hypothetical protein Q9225_001383 [Loekoesia sp. 1 TL-2023]
MDSQWIPPSPRFAIQDDRVPTPSPFPSRSPHKRHTSTAKVLDPLLSHLSSTSALEALESSDAANWSSQDGLYRTITAASQSERALAIRAASAAKQLEEWQRELQEWQWPSSCNGFEAPDHMISYADFEQASGKEQGSGAIKHIEDAYAIVQEYWGSLPAQTVLAHQKRIDEIRDAMDALELNELKTHVRDAHLVSTSRQPPPMSSNHYGVETFSYNSLDDFTAVITTIVMQALPVISRLECLLRVWGIRLTVLRVVPGFVGAIYQTQQEMIAAWRTLGHSDNNKDGLPITRPFVLGLKARLESQIRDLGRRLDYMLDTLEGLQDTLPSVWIDDMEQLEIDFANWVIEAERFVVDLELSTREDSLGWHEGSMEEQTSSPKWTSSGMEKRILTAFDGQDIPSDPVTGELDHQALDGSTSTSDLSLEQDHLSLPDGVMYGHDSGHSSFSHQPLPLNLQHHRNHSNAISDFSSESSCPGSATSDYFSNMSSPEIQDASKTEYFGVGSPVEVTTPGFLRRQSKESDQTVSRQSSQRTARGDRLLSAITSPALSRASTVIPGRTIDEDENQATTTAGAERQSPNMAAGNASQDAEFIVALKDLSPTPPIPTKSRHRFEEFTDLSPGNTPAKVIRRRTADSADAPIIPPAQAGQTATASPTKSTDEELEARISSILTDIPANIRLTRGLDANLDRIGQSPGSRNSKFIKKLPTPRLMRSQTAISSPPAMTLTPANQKTARAQNGESEIKLYHLHQLGKEAPIKLFVRLVGEGGERVMVRIGGGWADLAEYLKEYAIHHGRRTVSDGRFEIEGLPYSQSSSPVTKSGSLSNNHIPRSRPGSPSAERSTPVVSSAKRRFSTGVANLPSTPEISPDHSTDTRPTSRDSNASSTGSWTGDDSPSLGLAGPKSRKATVSPNKQAWVDTMIEKARSGSSEKKKGTRNAFGDLGIMGGTKRLLLKREKEAVVWIRLDNDQVRFTVIPERGSQVWAVLSIVRLPFRYLNNTLKLSTPSQESIFEDYVIQSATPNNTINLQVSLTHLNRALRSALTALTASLRLTKKDNIPLLSLTILTNTLTSFRPPAPSLEPQLLPSDSGYQAGVNDDSVSFADGLGPNTTFSHDRETTITQSIPVTVLAPASVANIHEPRCREPDVHILLPPLLQLKSISERFTRLALPAAKGNTSSITSESSSIRLTISASPYGELKLGVQTSALKIESQWSGLTNPELDPGQVDGGEEGVRDHASTKFKERARDEAWATVRVEGRDWGRVLGVGRLGGRVVACELDVVR